MQKLFHSDEVEVEVVVVVVVERSAGCRREIATQMSSGNGKCTKLNLMNIKIMQQQETVQEEGRKAGKVCIPSGDPSAT